MLSCLVAGAAQKVLAASTVATHAPITSQHGLGSRSQASGSSGAAGPSSSVSLAREVVLDWPETHGGVILLSGAASNVAAFSDSVGWSQNFLRSCGPLVPFLRAHGVTQAGDADAITFLTA